MAFGGVGRPFFLIRQSGHLEVGLPFLLDDPVVPGSARSRSWCLDATLDLREMCIGTFLLIWVCLVWFCRGCHAYRFRGEGGAVLLPIRPSGHLRVGSPLLSNDPVVPGLARSESGCLRASLDLI